MFYAVSPYTAQLGAVKVLLVRSSSVYLEPLRDCTNAIGFLNKRQIITCRAHMMRQEVFVQRDKNVITPYSTELKTPTLASSMAF